MHTLSFLSENHTPINNRLLRRETKMQTKEREGNLKEIKERIKQMSTTQREMLLLLLEEEKEK